MEARSVGCVMHKKVSHLAQNQSLQALERESRDKIECSGLFRLLAARQSPRSETYTADCYLKPLSIYSVLRRRGEGPGAICWQGAMR
jgi:hypothetical protein